MMKTRLKLAIKLVAFVLLTCLCVKTVNEWMIPKDYYNAALPTTNTYKEFYKLKKDSVDVLFLGSSHAVCAFNPQVIYDNYGVTSYNLGSGQQSLLASYYWLREALKYQSPKVVVLETFTCFRYSDKYVYNKINCDEPSLRKPIDNMRLSPLKVEAARDIERLDPTQIGLSYILRNIRYHSRWTYLEEDDFTERSMTEHAGIKGFKFNSERTPGDDVTFYDADSEAAEAIPMADIAEEYLGRIEELCDKNGITLIFVKVPSSEAIGKYKTMKEYTQTKGIPFYDFNEDTLYHEINYIADNMYYHVNYEGAEKISNYLGRLFKEQYDVPSREDDSYEASGQLYRHRLEYAKLKETTDIYEYLDQLDKDRYDIFVLGAKNFGTYIDDDISSRLHELGFDCELSGVPEDTHYCAVKSSGKVVEKLSSEDIKFSGSVRKGLVTYSYNIDTTIMVTRGHKYQLFLDGEDYGSSMNGLMFLIYDEEMKQIVDRVNFDTSTEELTATRE